MIQEFQAGISVFHEGQALANASVWKNRQLAGNHVVALLSGAVVIAKGCGFNIPVDQDTLQTAGLGLAAIVTCVNSLLTVITSTKVGFKPK
jgi:hypothetical protein